jgi:hypothetical protein
VKIVDFHPLGVLVALAFEPNSSKTLQTRDLVDEDGLSPSDRPCNVGRGVVASHKRKF